MTMDNLIMRLCDGDLRTTNKTIRNWGGQIYISQLADYHKRLIKIIRPKFKLDNTNKS